MNKATKALKTLRAVSRPGSPTRQAAVLGLAEIERLRKQRDEARRDHAVPGMYALGYALFYFQFSNRDHDYGDQVGRVHALCERWVDLRAREHAAMLQEFDLNEDPDDKKWEAFLQGWAPEWDKLLEDIDDECENLC